MAMSCFVRTKGPSVLEVGYSIDYDMAGGIPEKDYECFEALAEAGMALHVKAFAGMSMVKLQHTPSFYLNTEGRDYVGSPSKSRWWAADYMLAAVGRLVGPVYEVRLGYYSSQYRAV